MQGDTKALQRAMLSREMDLEVCKASLEREQDGSKAKIARLTKVGVPSWLGARRVQA